MSKEFLQFRRDHQDAKIFQPYAIIIIIIYQELMSP
jgi:hypothetical protein